MLCKDELCNVNMTAYVSVAKKQTFFEKKTKKIDYMIEKYIKK